MTTDFLLGRTADPEVFAEADDPMYRNFERLSSDDRELARELMELIAKRRKAKRQEED